MSAYNYSPQVEFFGDLRVDNAGSNAKSVARRGDVAGLSFITSIAAGSQNMLSVSDGALSVDSLLITDVTVDTTYTTLAAWIANGIPSGFKQGDIVILTAADPSLSYISKVVSPTQASDFALLNDGNTYSAGNGISLSGSVFSADPVWLRTDGNVFSAGNGISLSGAGALSADAAWLRTDGNVFTAGTGISNSSGTLAVSLSGGTGIGVSGATISFNGDTDDVSEGSSNKYFTDARSRASVSLASVSSPDTQLISYNSSTGVFSLPASDVFAQFSGSAGISFSNGDISFSGDTDDVSEGSTNKYYTDARSRAALSQGTGIFYNSTTGVISGSYSGGDGIEITGDEIAIDASFLRFSASNVSLTANQAYTVTHNLGMKLVQTAFLRTSDSKKIDLEVTFSSTTALSIKSSVNVTVDIAVSI